MLVALDGPGGLQKLQSAIAAEPRLTVDVLREQDYFSSQTRDFRRQIGFLAGLVTIIMALGAVFAALNSMYAAVAARGKEIATLRAIGFGGAPVVVSVMIEALLLALARRRAGGAARLPAVQQPVGGDARAELHAGGVQLQGHTHSWCCADS